MRAMTPKSILLPGIWWVLLPLAFATACTGNTGDALTEAEIEINIETAVAATVALTTPIVSADITATVAATVAATLAATVATAVPTTRTQAPPIDIESAVATAVEGTAAAAVDAAAEIAKVELDSIINATVEAAVKATMAAMPAPTPTLERPTPEATQEAMKMDQPTVTPIATATDALPTPTQVLASVPQEDPTFQEVAIIENYAATRFFPKVIVVLRGIPVRLYLTRLHREHVNQFAIDPFLRSSEVILPGEIGVLDFTPHVAGTFKIRNVGHNFSADLIVVESKEDVSNFYADRGRQMYALIHSIDDFQIFPEKLTVQDGVPVTVFNISLIAEHRVSFEPFYIPEENNVQPREISMIEFAPDQQGAFSIHHELHGFSGAMVVE